MRRIRSISIAAIACLAAGAAGGAPEEWEREVRLQAVEELGCDIAFINEVVEQEMDGDLAVFAKIHCVDGRAFDAARMSVLDLFSFRECAYDTC